MKILVDIQERVDKFEEKLCVIEKSISVLETRFEHTLNNKHAEAISISKAIDLKFKWISIIIGGLAALGVVVSILKDLV